MNRYYLVADADMPTPENPMQVQGPYHFIDLTSHGRAGDKWNVMCVEDTRFRPPPTWLCFPSIYETSIPISTKIPAEVLADIGLTGEESTIAAAEKLGEIIPSMGL